MSQKQKLQKQKLQKQKLQKQKLQKQKLQKQKLQKPRAANRKGFDGTNRLCECVGILSGAAKSHRFGKHELSEPSPNNVFLSLLVPQLSCLIAQKGYDLESTRARLWLNYNKNRIHVFNAEQQAAHATAEQRESNKKAYVEERQRRIEAQKFAKQAAQNAVSFLSLRYGKSVEQRKELLDHQQAHQLKRAESCSISSLNDNLGRARPWLKTSTSTSECVIKQQPLTQYGDFSSSNVSGPGPVISCQSPSESNFSPIIPISLFSHLDQRPHLSSAKLESVESGKVADFLVCHPSSIRPFPQGTNMSSQPVPDATGGVDSSIKEVIQNLFVLQQHISAYRSENQERLTQQVEEVARSLGDLERTVSKPNNPLHNVRVAPDIIDYVDDGRNPDIYTRDFVELVQRGNSVMNGKQKAFRDFSKVFATALKNNFDGMGNEVDMIMLDAGMEEKEGKFVDKDPGNRNGA